MTTNVTVYKGDERDLRTSLQSRQNPLQACFEEALYASLDESADTRERILASSFTLPLQKKLSSTAHQERPTSHTRRKIHAHFDGQDQENKEVQA